VLVRYGDQKLVNPMEVAAMIIRAQSTQHAGEPAKQALIPVKAWRDGKCLELTVRPGKLGVLFNGRPAAEAILAKREGDRLLAVSRGDAFQPLPGTRREVESISTLFQKPMVLLGSDANEQRLDELASKGELKHYRYLHFATHAVTNDKIAMQSALILSQDHLPDQAQQVLAGKPRYSGRLSAETVLKHWKLDADLVTLSACQSGLGKEGGGEGYLGFSQALFLAGARSLVLSLWKVDDRATALLMTRFYQNLLGKRSGLSRPMAIAESLKEAKEWLRRLTSKEIHEALSSLPRGEEPAEQPTPVTHDEHPYAHPYFWAAFILIGDPE
jgi:CHAT domain-containing protein